jgi:transcriptional regulator with XRE-family HTH domain
MYCDVMATSIAQVVGANVRRRRLDAKVTLDQFAQAARFCGLSAWSTGRVGDLEAGRIATLTLETLYAVALALHQATGRPVSLADLLTGEEPVQINDKLTVDTSALRGAVSGEPATGSTDALDRLGAVMHKGTTTALARMLLDEFRESDVRMCKTLGVSPEVGAAAMAKLWRRTFSAERDHRAEPDANAQRKGQISRQLKTELEKATGRNG